MTKLSLARETVATLTPQEAQEVAGGYVLNLSIGCTVYCTAGSCGYCSYVCGGLTKTCACPY